MELWEEITYSLSQNQPSNKKLSTKVFELQCYIALNKIKAILENESLNDKDCFFKIEQIISVYEQMGVKISFRHDF